ncbi:hypothetical protein [Noviherbaspirillum sp. ST9]|uniref:hypothetical protein n=1 Tax=Noviherbaspirillum sp. ST9 TaxID=3401606 RepID=UPI003B586739
MRIESAAEALGYSTSSTLRQACAGTTFLSVEKLLLLAQLTTADGKAKASIDWLLTGEGAPTRPVSAAEDPYKSLLDRIVLAGPEIQRQVEAFLDVHLVPGRNDGEKA